MDNRKEHLKQWLQAANWTSGDREWMLQYLDGEDLSELEEMAATAYEADIAAEARTLDRGHSEQMLKRIHQHIQPTTVSYIHTMWAHRWKVAVAAMLLLIAGMGYYTWMHSNSGQVFTAKKERKTLKLTDGTTVYLEPGAELTCEKTFGDKTRTVHLSGEAFFEVATDAVHPFMISTSLIHTTVLGTSFNIASDDHGDASVTVVSGKVRVVAVDGHGQGGVEIGANEGVTYNSSLRQLERDADATRDARYFAQKQAGRFVYKGASIEDVVNDLERYYNTTIRTEERIRQCAFYGDFSTSDDLEKSLTLISVALNAKFSVDSSGKGYVLSGGSCH
ncbi:FecR domain-containing protein [Chitinophaga pendula]|uniref:FecR family protein n=1 Tax=Chitinophaga TaxID=79328 RepID=UPI000BAF0C78|nr:MULTISPECIES: FecR domain-containing protein [Chitinophaga]ASZ14224.1 hypothetical protein CK934_26370 [Chitinophaga sp. MD30]UCJ08136.1 FecR domain-containing protein [Chitinophaga pendula]